MAKIKFGMMMTDARGKLGGQVFSKNRSGAYVRTKVTPVNPRTTFQQLSRSILGTLSAGWSALTDAQRASFNSAVEDWQKTDIFGDLKKPTGKNLYTGLNKNLAQSGQDLVSVAPQKTEFPDLLDITAGISTLTNAFVFEDFPTLTNGYYQVMMTPPLSAGTNFVRNRLRVIGYAVNNADLVALVNANYSTRFGSHTAQNNIHFSVKIIGNNGQTSVPLGFKLSAITPD